VKFRQKSVKISAKNNIFQEISAEFCGKSRKFIEFLQNFEEKNQQILRSERCEGMIIL